MTLVEVRARLGVDDYNAVAASYLLVLCASGLALLATGAAYTLTEPAPSTPTLLVCAFVAAFAAFFPFRIVGTGVQATLAGAATLYCLLTLGPWAACVVAAVEGSVAAWRATQRWTSRFFIPASAVVAAFVWAGIYGFAAELAEFSALSENLTMLVGSTVAGIGYSVTSSALVLTVRGLKRRQRPELIGPALALAFPVSVISLCCGLVIIVDQLTGEPVSLWVASLFALLVLGQRSLESWRVDREAKAQSQFDKLEKLANQDSLTGLPNRRELLQRLDKALSASCKLGATYVGVLYIDLDGFKAVNDGLGHRAGDELLQTLAARLQAQVRADDCVARIGGDEFAVLVPGVTSTEFLTELAARLLGCLKKPVTVTDGTAKVGASIGAALSGGADHRDGSQLLHAADMALLEAKGKGKGRVVWAP